MVLVDCAPPRHRVAAVVLALGVACAVTPVVGLASLASPDQAVGDPVFATLEVLVILMTPAVLGPVVAVHAWTPDRLKTLGARALVFAALLAAPAATRHFAILTVSRQPQSAQAPWPLVFSFARPSIAYAVATPRSPRRRRTCSTPSTTGSPSRGGGSCQ